MNSEQFKLGMKNEELGMIVHKTFLFLNSNSP